MTFYWRLIKGSWSKDEFVWRELDTDQIGSDEGLDRWLSRLHVARARVYHCSFWIEICAVLAAVGLEVGGFLIDRYDPSFVPTLLFVIAFLADHIKSKNRFWLGRDKHGWTSTPGVSFGPNRTLPEIEQ
ncbi:MAG: hypothetical protein F4Y95_01890 [Chloroflexi bacterium]|nr:hypothetical protein [Chloroflexota bacterium]